MSGYRRPPIVTPEFRDADGRVIDYGRRWDSGEPPEETYSVTAHPERFEPLHKVADALVEHLHMTYDVEVRAGTAIDDVDGAWRSRHGSAYIERVVRVQPRDPQCAPLTFIHTRFPGITVQAGALHEFGHPHCGCDACDDSVEEVLGELEKLVSTVVDGWYQESVSRHGRWVEHSLRHADGSAESGRSRTTDFPKDRFDEAKATLSALDGSWAPWPRR